MEMAVLFKRKVTTRMKAGIFMFTLLLNAAANDDELKTACEISSANERVLTCHFPVNILNKERNIKVVYLQNNTESKEDTVGYCVWSDGKQDCKTTRPGYIFDGNLSDSLRIRLPQAPIGNGRYVCFMTPTLPDKYEFCSTTNDTFAQDPMSTSNVQTQDSQGKGVESNVRSVQDPRSNVQMKESQGKGVVGTSKDEEVFKQSFLGSMGYLVALAVVVTAIICLVALCVAVVICVKKIIKSSHFRKLWAKETNIAVLSSPLISSSIEKPSSEEVV